MTCIVAVIDDGNVYMGGDSAAVSGWNRASYKPPKVFKKGLFLFGYTSSFRMGQILQYRFMPENDPEDLDVYMHTGFIDSLRKTFKEEDFAETTNGKQSGGNFLVGFKGRLFNVQSDYAITESTISYDAVGGGAEYAKGSLFSTKGMKPKERLMIALQAAQEHNMGVREPFNFISTKTEELP